MNFFSQLGRLVDDRWRLLHRNEDALPDAALAALAELPPCSHTTPQEIISFALQQTQPSFPPQENIAATFGQPPITLFRTERFYVEALFWIDGTTKIHQHGFTGAFHVLDGSSIHTTFDFDPDEFVNGRLQLGTLRTKRIELLERGTSRAILPGKTFIHSLFHLERPSVSIVIRTYTAPFVQPQFSYLWPGVAIDPFDDRPGLRRRLQILGMLQETDRSAFERSFAQVASDLDRDELVALLLETHHFFGTSSRVMDLLSPARKHQGSFVDRLEPVVGELIRKHFLTTRRRTLKEVTHRFFLALLLNVRGGENLLKAVATRYPDVDVITQVVKWFAEMSAVPSSSHEEPFGALSVTLDDTVLEVLGLMLRSKSNDAVLCALRDDYEDVDSQMPNILELCNAIKACPLFSPFFERTNQGSFEAAVTPPDPPDLNIEAT